METPTWSSDGGFVTITFKRSDFKSDIIENDKEDKKITEGGKYPLSTPQVELLIQKMEDSYMTMRNMADVCDIKDLKYFRESYITPALEEGLIERLYPNQPKHPKQQYRLTEMAKEWLTSNAK
jgi:ATP-dependent DNA helicase recG